MKKEWKIPLENSDKFALCDKNNFKYFKKFKWFETEDGYAARYDARRGIVYMHDEVVRRNPKYFQDQMI